MPRNVKAFIWLGALYVLFGAALLTWSLYSVSQETANAVHLSAQMRDSLARDLLHSVLHTFAIHTAIFGALAGFAAFGGFSWSRWLMAIYFLLVQLMPFIKALWLYILAPRVFLEISGGVEGWWFDYLRNHWLQPRVDWPGYVAITVQIALIALIFSPNARPWFRRTPDDA